MALPKQHRLRHRQDFSQVYRKGMRRTSQSLTLRALHCHSPAEATEPSSSSLVHPSPPTQIGISISSKVSKRSVVRNRIRRQIQAAFQSLLSQLSPSWWLVVVVHPQAIECDYQQFLQELKQLLADAEVINGNS